MDVAEVAADLHTKPVMPVPTCSCKYVSLLELSVTIACKKTPMCVMNWLRKLHPISISC